MVQGFLILTFVICFFSIIILPIRLALLVYIIAGNFDIGSIEYAPTTLNAVKIIFFPLILFLRIKGWNIILQLVKKQCFAIFLLFILYASITISWTSYKVDALKEVGYLLTYALTVAVFYKAWKMNKIYTNDIIIISSATLIFGILQTYFMGNPFGITLYQNRLNTFIPKNAFAEFLAGAVVWLLFIKDKQNGLARFLITMGILIAVILNGGRTAFICTVVTIMLWIINELYKKNIVKVLKITLPLVIAITAVLGSFYFNLISVEKIKELRIYEITYSFDKSNVTNVSTLENRLKLWSLILKSYSSLSPFKIFFGKGLSSSGEINRTSTANYRQLSAVTGPGGANRIIHNEFIRSLYETGLIGFLTLVLFVFTLMIKSALAKASLKIAYVSMVISFSLFMFTENFFTSAGNLGGIIFSLLFAYMATDELETNKTNRKTAMNLPRISGHLEEPELYERRRCSDVRKKGKKVTRANLLMGS